MNATTLDAQIRAGVISADAFADLLGAENYGAATTMQWLNSRLGIIRQVIASGQPIDAHTPTGPVRLSTDADFQAWCANYFPDAFACFIRQG